MGYLNTSMTKRAGALPAAILAALGATGGGLAGYYGSDKANNTPSTVLGALGGGAGTIAGAIAGARSTAPIDDELERLHRIKSNLGSVGFTLKRLKGRSNLLPYEMDEIKNLLREQRELKKSLVRVPKWVHALAKNPGRRVALELGVLGLGATAGGALGAKLGIMGGDALA